MKKLIFTSVLLLAVIPFCACSSDNDEPNHVIGGKDLPKIQSFEWCDHLYSGEQIIDGLNEFQYDALGRVIKWSSDDQQTTYTYADNHTATGKCIESKNGNLLQDQSLTFSDSWLPLSQTSLDEDGNTQEAYYGYDSKGRLENYEFSISDGRRRAAKLIYDSKTGLVSHMEFSKINNANEESAPETYTFEYYDRENPVAFYPENSIFVDAEASFAIPGLDGYFRDKLIKSITFPWRLEKGEYMSYHFNYSFDPNNEKMTAINVTIRLLDENGNVKAEVRFADFLNIKY